MNKRFSALLIVVLAGLSISGQALAGSRFMDGGLVEFSVRDDQPERAFGNREERQTRKANRQQEKKDERKAQDDERGRGPGYGYGYERRYMKPRQDDRGRP